MIETKRNRKSALITTLSAVLALGVLYLGAPVWIPLVFSVFLFIILDPIVAWGERRGIARAVSSLFLVILSVIAIGGALWAGYASARRVAVNVPRFELRLQRIMTEVLGREAAPAPPPAELPKVEVVEKPSSLLFSSPIWAGVNSALGMIGITFFVPMITLVMLWERRPLATRIERLFASPVIAHQLSRRVKRMTYGFFFGNFIVGLGMAVLFSAQYFFLGLEDALIYGSISGFLNLLPIFGPIFGSVLPVLQALIQFEAVWPAWSILGASILVHFVSANLLIPKIVGGRVNVNATAGTIGLLIWGALWGVTGLFLAIPLMAVLRITLETFPRGRKYSALLEDFDERAVVPALATAAGAETPSPPSAADFPLASTSRKA